MSGTPAPALPRGYGVALLGLVLAWIVFCGPWFWGGKIIPNDAKNHFYPMIRFLAASWYAGESAFWSPYHYGGFPMIADPQSMIFTPTFWPAVLAGPAPSMRLVDAIHLAHLLGTGAAVLGFARLRGWRAEAGFAAALAFMFSGALVLRLEHLLMTVSTMWFAVCLWRLEAVLRLGGLWRGLAFGMALGLLLIDRNHVAYLAAWFLVLYWVARSWPGPRARVPVAHQGAVILGGIGALALATVPVLLTLQLSGLSNRPAFSYELASFQALHPAALTTLILPDYFGLLDRWGSYWGPASTAWGGERLFMHRGMLHGYAGGLAAVLILWQGVGHARLLRREAALFLGLAAVFLVYALGRYTPVFEGLYAWVPGVDLFRRPADALFMVGPALGLLTGALLHDMLTRPAPVSRGGVLLAIVIAGAVVVVLGDQAMTRERPGAALDAALRAGLLWVALGGLLLAARMRDRRGARLALVGLCVLSAADLIDAGSNARLNALPPRFYDQQENPAAAPPFARLAELLADKDPAGASWRVETVGLGASVQNIGQAAGFEALLGYNPVRLASFERLIAPDHQNNAAARRHFGTRMTSYDSPMADRLGLRYIATSLPIDEIDAGADPARFRLLEVFDHNDREIRIYENPRALPRARILGDADAPPPRITRYDHGEIRLSVTCTRPCRLVLHDIAYPGWTALANGRATAVHVEDGIFRSVDLAPGETRLVFAFRPLSRDNLGAMVKSVLFGEAAR